MDLKQPLISVIIPIYNTERFLKMCLDSVISQTYNNIEVILVDDGSTDDSGAICDEYCSRDERFKVFHRQNQGVGQSRNFALDIASGEYIAFIDSDDCYHPQFLEVLYGAINRTQQLVAMCGFDGVEENETPEMILLENPDRLEVSLIPQAACIGKMIGDKKYVNDSRLPFAICFHSMANKLYHRSLFEKRRLTRDIAEDTEFNLSIYLELPSIAYVSPILYFYTKRAGSLSRSNNNRIFISGIKNYFESYRMLLQNKYPQYEKCFIWTYFKRFLSRRAIVKGTENEEYANEVFNDLATEFYPDLKRLVPWHKRVVWRFFWNRPRLCHLLMVRIPQLLKSMIH